MIAPATARPCSKTAGWLRCGAVAAAGRALAQSPEVPSARALHRGEAAIAARLPQARETKAGNTLAAVPRLDLIHPGVLRYFGEIGSLRSAIQSAR